MARRMRWRAALAAAGVAIGAVVGLQAYRSSLLQKTLSGLESDYGRLGEIRRELAQRYLMRASLLEAWMGSEEFKKRRFPLPARLETQDDFDLFELGQNQISEELARRLTPERTRELFAVEEGIFKRRSEYHALARGVIQALDDAAAPGPRPPVFRLDLENSR